MLRLDIVQIDRNLLADIDGDTTGWELYEGEDPHATVANQAFQVVFSPDHRRAGIVFVGSGSSGHTSWTDATSPDEAMQLFHDDDLRP